MTAPETGMGWAVRVPVGYRVGAWEVTAPIATGNFGSVYAARRFDGEAHAADVALKFMATGPSGLRRFREIQELAQREVAFSKSVAHERLITVHHSLVVEDPDTEFDGAVVLVMERAEKSLQDLLDEAASRLPLPDAARLTAQICEGLEYLHSSGWVHGDLKPSNILLTADGSVRLADFGLVTQLDGTHGYGLPLGSTDYSPPERWDDQLGERGVRVRTSADVWALGITAYQLVTGGSFPFAGGTAGTRAAAAQEFAAGRTPLRLQSDLNEDWREFIVRCLTPDHVNRPSARELLDRARRLADEARPPRTWDSRRVRSLVYVLAPLAATAGVWWTVADHGTPAQADTTVQLRVYNAEVSCRDDPAYSCSLGLALDPHQPYDADNVSKHRVRHGDRLAASCVVYDATRVSDEYGVGSNTWYRVAVDVEPSGYAWLPAVRTRDDASKLTVCPS
ncbi:serine/threonine-protein kinase [Dactylosporangium sp. NPDC048998]|uniref:serine/threonine-protein kinase n=1 Tax=Dactylosporangium sp. NPDC048998 TaxID=3363976 RepID=UPI0037149A50